MSERIADFLFVGTNKTDWRSFDQRFMACFTTQAFLSRAASAVIQ
jgi:hypothetical protein